MSRQVAIAKAGAAALAGLIALASAAPAAAQPYGRYDAYDRSGYHYDPCKRDQTQRGTAGALIGGGMGAVIGSNAAARNARTEGALLGGLLGAVVGGVVGNKSAACDSTPDYGRVPPPPPPPETSYYDRDPYPAPARGDGWSYDGRGERYRLSDRPVEADGCTLAESPIYMPDGRTQTRFVRVCRDASGKYAVVD